MQFNRTIGFIAFSRYREIAISRSRDNIKKWKRSRADFSLALRKLASILQAILERESFLL